MNIIIGRVGLSVCAQVLKAST